MAKTIANAVPRTHPRLELVRNDEHAARLAAEEKAKQLPSSQLSLGEWNRLCADRRVDALCRDLKLIRRRGAVVGPTTPRTGSTLLQSIRTLADALGRSLSGAKR